jgi:hypothetical protein
MREVNRQREQRFGYIFFGPLVIVLGCRLVDSLFFRNGGLGGLGNGSILGFLFLGHSEREEQLQGRD